MANFMESRDREFIERLLNWFVKNKREFSWRKPGLDPFHLLVAELMLQKTGANQVEKIFPSFIQKFPTPMDIVTTPVEVLERELESLGLQNRRARDLKRLSETLEEEGGQIPHSAKDLMKLPGIGEYIANAILCFAFNDDVLLVDANIARIMERFFSFKIKGAPTRDRNLWERMSHLIIPGRARESNLALLDFGALICIPRNPRCDGCCMLDICTFGKQEVKKKQVKKKKKGKRKKKKKIVRKN